MPITRRAIMVTTDAFREFDASNPNEFYICPSTSQSFGAVTQSSCRWPLTGVIRNFYVFVRSNTANGTILFRLWIDDNLSTLIFSLSVSAGATGVFDAVTQGFSGYLIARGTKLAFSIQRLAATSGIIDGGTITIDFRSSLRLDTILATDVINVDSSTLYYGFATGADATENRVQTPYLKKGFIRRLMLHVFTNTRNITSTFNLRVNGVNKASLSISAGATGLFDSGAIAVSVSINDLLSIQYVPGVSTGNLRGGTITIGAGW